MDLCYFFSVTLSSLRVHHGTVRRHGHLLRRRKGEQEEAVPRDNSQRVQLRMQNPIEQVHLCPYLELEFTLSIHILLVCAIYLRIKYF